MEPPSRCLIPETFFGAAVDDGDLIVIKSG
jgi:hypothetical protein